VTFHHGQTVVVREVWRDRLWSAVPHIWVDDGPPHITYVPQGTVGTYASNRGLPYTKGMTREERKLAAMRTCDYRVVERSTDISLLYFFTPGSWARVNLGWSDDKFIGWYVNFESPVEYWSGGLQSKDLVLDLQISPDGRWRWKDRDSFAAAVADGLLAGDLLPQFERAAARILQLLDRRIGPFEPTWREWTPEPQWDTPVLPADMGIGGDGWNTPIDS
jgi:protein associated with RNAse G/E